MARDFMQKLDEMHSADVNNDHLFSFSYRFYHLSIFYYFTKEEGKKHAMATYFDVSFVRCNGFPIFFVVSNVHV